MHTPTAPEVFCPNEGEPAVVVLCRTLRHPMTRQPYCSACGMRLPNPQHINLGTGEERLKRDYDAGLIHVPPRD